VKDTKRRGRKKLQQLIRIKSCIGRLRKELTLKPDNIRHPRADLKKSNPDMQHPASVKRFFARASTVMKMRY
jgi:hypothetical protein